MPFLLLKTKKDVLKSEFKGPWSNLQVEMLLQIFVLCFPPSGYQLDDMTIVIE